MTTADTINLVVAIATFFMAVFTAWMACETRRLAKEGRDSTKMLERHHQEGLAPIVKFLPDSNGIHFQWESNPEGCRLMLNGTISNSGLGPALNIRMTPMVQNFTLPLPVLISTTIGPQEQLPSSYLKIIDCNKENCHFLKSNENNWIFKIEYMDLFGNPYSTIQKFFDRCEPREINYLPPENFLTVKI